MSHLFYLSEGDAQTFMEATLTGQDVWSLKDELVERGLLTKCQPEVLTRTGQLIVTPCADGKHFLEMIGHLARECAQQGKPQPHPVNGNHGGIIYHARPSTIKLMLPTEYEWAADQFRVAVRIVKEALHMEKGDTFLGLIHWPCAKGAALGLSLLEMIYLAVDARDHYILHQIEPDRVNVGIMFARPRPGGKLRRHTWMIQAEAWKREAPPIERLRYQEGRGLRPGELWG